MLDCCGRAYHGRARTRSRSRPALSQALLARARDWRGALGGAGGLGCTWRWFGAAGGSGRGEGCGLSNDDEGGGAWAGTGTGIGVVEDTETEAVTVTGLFRRRAGGEQGDASAEWSEERPRLRRFECMGGSVSFREGGEEG